MTVSSARIAGPEAFVVVADDLGEALPGGPRVIDARVADVLEVERADAPRRLRLVHLAALVRAQKPFDFL